MAQVIKEYAEALFELSQETGNTDEISAALDTVSALMEENPEYLDFLSSPNIPKAERVGSVEQAFEGKIHEYVLSLLSILCDRGRIRNLSECISEYRQLCDEANRISVAEVVSAVELSDSEKSSLTVKLEKLCGNTVVLSCKTDASILGGMIVTVDGKVIDGSIRHKLHELKEVMHK